MKRFNLSKSITSIEHRSCIDSLISNKMIRNLSQCSSIRINTLNKIESFYWNNNRFTNILTRIRTRNIFRFFNSSNIAYINSFTTSFKIIRSIKGNFITRSNFENKIHYTRADFFLRTNLIILIDFRNFTS